jgi:hypothetical protein
MWTNIIHYKVGLRYGPKVLVIPELAHLYRFFTRTSALHAGQKKLEYTNQTRERIIRHESR